MEVYNANALQKKVKYNRLSKYVRAVSYRSLLGPVLLELVFNNNLQ